MIFNHDFQVVLANTRDEGSGRDPREDLKMLRIFVIIPKSYTEEDLRNDFKVRPF